MDKRTQLAVILIALILGGQLSFSAYQQKKHAEAARAKRAAFVQDSLLTAASQPQPVPVAPGSTSPADTVAPAAPGSVASGTAAAPAQAAAGGIVFTPATAADGEWVVETPLQHIRIARAGAVLREIALQHYKVYDDGPVNLAPAPAAGHEERVALGLRLITPQGESRVDQARFELAAGDVDAQGVLHVATGSAPQTLVLRAEAQGGGAVVKTFTFDPARYDFTVNVKFEPGAGMPARLDAYTLEWSTGMPMTESNHKEDEQRMRAVIALDTEQLRRRPGDFKKTPSATGTGTIHWAALQTKYFMVGLIPAEPFPGNTEITGDPKTHWLGMTLRNSTPGRASDTYRVYAGPIVFDQVRALGVGLESTVELGYRWIRPISSALVHFLGFLNRFIPNYGLVIIVVSVLAKLLFWPLTEKSFKSMRRMQELQPRMEEIRKRYKDDPKGMNEQMMLMYKDQKVNPVGGCVPMLVQMPMFFALFSALQSSIQLRNAPFFGWIDNLAGPDVLFRFPTTLPLLGDHFSLLPILMGGAMMWQSHLTPQTMGTGAQSGAMAQQQIMMKYLMPVMMTVFFYRMPSGLVVYWIVTTLMSIWQQTHINRKFAPVKSRV